MTFGIFVYFFFFVFQLFLFSLSRCGFSFKIYKWHEHSPNQIELFSLSQCSNSGRIRISSTVDNGFSIGKCSRERFSGSLNCHINKITKSIDSKPVTMVYNFQGSTFFWKSFNEQKRTYISIFAFWNRALCSPRFNYLWILFLLCGKTMYSPYFAEHGTIG